MGALKPWHIIVLVVVLILLFGAKRLPDAARSLGRSLRIIKAETKGLVDDDKDDLAEKADAQHARQPLDGTYQPGAYGQPGASYGQPHPGQYGQQPPAGPNGQPGPYGQPAPPYTDPVQRTRDH